MVDRTLQSPGLVRALPFAVFIALTFFQDAAGETGRYWIYLAKTVAGAMTLLLVYRHIGELQWRFSPWAVLAGIGVFALWIGLDGHYPSSSELYTRYVCPLLAKAGLAKDCQSAAAQAPWNPNDAFGTGATLSVFFLVVRIVGSTLLVPIIEEVFWRSFIYRFIASRDFDREPLGRFYPLSFLLTSVLFGLEHREWLPGILCGVVYQALVVWKNRLGDAVAAHAITNFLLGAWVVWKGAWHFW